MTEAEVSEDRSAPIGPDTDSEGRPKRQVRIMIIGGVILIIIGIALAIYMGLYEDEPFLIALGPAFIGVMIVIAALFGKRLKR